MALPRTSISRASRREPNNTAWFLAALVLLAVLATSADALAVTITDPPDNDSGFENPTINRTECQANQSLSYTLADVTDGETVSVWASGTEGTDCAAAMNRTGPMPLCIEIVSGSAVIGNSVTISFGVQTLGNALTGVTNCEDTSNVVGLRPVTVFFLVNAASADPAESITDQVDFDVVGPQPPTNVEASVHDDTSLRVTFTASTSQDVKEYQAYCDPNATETSGATTTATSGATTAATTTTGAGGTLGVGGAGGTLGVGGAGGTLGVGGAGGMLGVGGAGGMLGVGGAGGDMGAGGTMGTGGTAATTATTTTATATSTGSGGTEAAECGSTLVGGEIPSGLTSCGTSTTGPITATGFTTGELGAVAVVAVDQVGNIGPLSQVVCETSKPVEDFFEAYREAGGRGGGDCGCRVAGERRDGAWLAAGCLLALVLRRRGLVLRREVRR